MHVHVDIFLAFNDNNDDDDDNDPWSNELEINQIRLAKNKSGHVFPKLIDIDSSNFFFRWCFVNEQFFFLVFTSNNTFVM